MAKSNRIIAGTHDLPRQHQCHLDVSIRIGPQSEPLEDGYVYNMTGTDGEIIDLDVEHVVEVCRDPFRPGVTHVTIHGSKTHLGWQQKA